MGRGAFDHIKAHLAGKFLKDALSVPNIGSNLLYTELKCGPLHVMNNCVAMGFSG